MIITVKDALNIWPLTLGEVIAGKNGLNRVIKSVSVLEVPKETKWFKGGELQISAFYAVANDEKSQLEVLRNLNSKNCSGLVLCHIGHWLKSISEAFINLADELKFPIIVVPEHLAYIDIITPIMNVILNKKRTDDRYALEIYRKMTSMLLDKKNIDHIVYMLSKSLNTTVLFFNSSNECMTTGHKEVSPSFINEIKGNILINLSEFNNDNEYIKVFSKLTGIIILLAPVIINKRYYGTITIFNKSDLNDLEMQTIAETKYACGLAVIESTRLEELKISAKIEFYTNLIHWNFKNESHAIEKASELNLDISKITLVLTVEILEDYVNYKNFNCVDSKTIIDEVYNILSETNKDKIFINNIITYEKRILLFINCNKDDLKTQNYAQHLGENIIKSIQLRMNVPVSVGIGNCYSSISKISDSYSESIMAIKMGNALFDHPHCTLYYNIELFSQLFESVDKGKISSVINNLFEPIKKYDQENNTMLISTFKTLIGYQFNTSKVSEKLFIHKNTVLQRKYKICELLGYNPEKYPYRQIFELSIILEKFVD